MCSSFHRVHRATRALIEHLNGQLKKKFMCLIGDGPRVRTPKAAINVITACCVLFNISKDDHIQEPYIHEPEEEDDDPRHDDDDEITGTAIRNEIVQNFFT